MYRFVKYFISICLLSVFCLLHSTFAYQQQGFTSYQEGYGNKIDFACESQCVVLLETLGSVDYLYVEGQLQGNGAIGYGFLMGDQVAPGPMFNINGLGTIEQKFLFSDNPYISQIPKDAQIVLIVQGNVQGSQVVAQGRTMGFGESLKMGFNQALKYKEYNPRTINFLEGPMRNGKYINQYFLWRIIGLLVCALMRYFASKDKQSKKKAVWFGVGVLVFFRVFFDFFSTVNQVKMYKQITSATNTMENGRVGRSSDFYPFLDFIKTKVPKGAQGAFIAPYPFEFEGKYHIYPDVKFNVITGVSYLFVYNPYGGQNPFNFVDPIYSGGVLIRNDLTFSVQEEIIWQPHAKIYILKNN